MTSSGVVRSDERLLRSEAAGGPGSPDYVLGVDLDGVCADFGMGLRRVAAEWLDVDVDTLDREPTRDYPEWGLGDAGGFEALYRYAVIRRNLFQELPPIPGASLTLRRLWTREGIRIRIITHRLYFEFFHRIAVTQTIEWLDRYDFPYWDLCFMKDKAAVGADLYVEDTPSNIEALRADGKKTIAFATSQNLAIGPPRAATWEEIEELVVDDVRQFRQNYRDGQALAGH